jgi:hypothetical protein
MQGRRWKVYTNRASKLIGSGNNKRLSIANPCATMKPLLLVVESTTRQGLESATMFGFNGGIT